MGLGAFGLFVVEGVLTSAVLTSKHGGAGSCHGAIGGLGFLGHIGPGIAVACWWWGW